MANVNLEKSRAFAPLPVEGVPKWAVRALIWTATSVVFLFVVIHRMMKVSGGRTYNPEYEDYYYFTDDVMGLWAGINWWDALWAACVWVPLSVIFLAAVCLDRRGNNYVLSALDARNTEGNDPKAIRKLRDWRNDLWKPRYIVGRSWYRTVSSRGDIVLALILVVSNLIWGLGIFTKVYLKHKDYYVEHGYYLPLTIGFLFGFYNGWAGMLNAGAAIFFTLRENHLTKVVMGPEGGEYFHGIKYHIALGYLAFAELSLHSVILFYSEVFYDKNDILPISWRGQTNFYGIMAFASLVVMVATSLYIVRRKNYRIFYWTHQLYIVFLFAAAVHFPSCMYPVIAPLLFFVYDRVAPRLNFARRNKAIFTRITDEIVRVDVPLQRKINQEYAPGDWINVLIPKANMVSWHPFSIGSFWPLTPDRFTLFIKKRGTWTDKLVNMSGRAMGEQAVVNLRSEGPFGARSKTYMLADGLLLVGGGTGIVALLPYGLQFALKHPSRPVKIVWIARCIEDVAGYVEFLTAGKNLEDLANLQIDLHLTRESGEEKVCLPIEQALAVEDITSSDEGEANANAPVVSPKEAAGNDAAANAVIAGAAPIDQGEDPVDTNTNAKEGYLEDASSESAQSLSDQARLETLGQVFRVSLVLAMLGGGIFAYFWTKAAFKDSWVDVCWSWRPETPFTALQIFKCFYAMPMAIIVACLFAALAGLIVYLLQAHIIRLSEQSKLEVPRPFTRKEFDFPWTLGRPNLDHVFEQISDAQGGLQWEVMAAGPERMVRDIEKRAIANRNMHYCRESWKV